MFISFRPVIGLHLGEFIAKQIVQVIQKYNFENKLEYFMFDKAKSNNNNIIVIINKLCPDFIKKKQKFYCIGHISNIVI